MIRPNSLAEFVGQQNARRILSVLITASKRRGEPVPHVLMSGPSGLGKTTLARIVASEMGGRLIEMVGSSLKNATEMTAQLMELRANDVLFIDEIHALSRKLEEIMYPAMEDRVITTTEAGFDDLMKQLGIRNGDKTRKTHQLPPFTLIGATTLLGLTTAPLRSRFRQIIELEAYNYEELQTIISNAATKLAFDVPGEVSRAIAIRSRGTARTAMTNLMWYRDYVQADGGIATMAALNAAFELKGIDQNGMTRTDREYLRRLIETDEPVGVETLASALGESPETLEESVEPFLLRRGFINRTPRGRTATEKAKQLMMELA
ncbi:MAG: Holliday junction branch migration DNA helicase RuvB [Verrucomicrobiia bacterium]